MWLEFGKVCLNAKFITELRLTHFDWDQPCSFVEVITIGDTHGERFENKEDAVKRFQNLNKKIKEELHPGISAA